MKTAATWLALVTAILFVSIAAIADEDPRVERHELMEGVRDAAKPVGAMLRGEAPFDAEQLEASLAVFEKAAGRFGELFPEGTETGMDTEAAPAIWTDREGFDAALSKFADAVAAAQAADASTLDEAKAAAGPIFQTCKGCHDSYRIDD